MPTLLGLGTSYIYKFLDFMSYCVSKKLRGKWIKNTGLWLIRGGGVTPLFGPHRDVQLNRPRCPKQGVEFWLAAVLNRVWYKEPRTFNPDCEQYLSFQSQKNLGWKGKRSCGAFFFSDLHNINWIKPTVTRTLQCHQSTSIRMLLTLTLTLTNPNRYRLI